MKRYRVTIEVIEDGQVISGSTTSTTITLDDEEQQSAWLAETLFSCLNAMNHATSEGDYNDCPRDILLSAALYACGWERGAGPNPDDDGIAKLVLLAADHLPDAMKSFDGESFRP